MADETEVIKIDTREAAKSLLDLRKELKEAQKELSNTKTGTAEYQKALEKLGATKDDIGDLNDQIKALNPEGKVAAFSNVAGKLAGGFQAATGAAALFGNQAQEVEEALLKVQAATAFAQGIQSVTALGDAFQVLKVAIASVNPVLLAIVVAVAAIAAAYKVWSENMSEAAKNDALLNAQLEKQRNLQESINDELDRYLEIQKATGVEGSKLLKLELEAEIKRYAAIQTRIILYRQLTELTEEQAAARDEDVKAEAASYNRLLTLKIQINKTEKAENDKLQEDRLAKIKETNDKILAADKAFRDKRRSEIAEAEAENQATQESIAATNAAIAQRESDEEVAKAKEVIEAKRLADEAEYNYERDSQNKRIKEDLDNKKLAAEESTRIAQQEAAGRKAAIAQSFEAAKALSDLYFAYQLRSVQKGSKAEQDILKKQFNINKAFAITDATIKGVLAVQQALGSLPPPFSFAVAAASGILAAANIAKIAATKFDAGSAGGGDTGSGAPGLAATSAPPVINDPRNTRTGTELSRDGTAKNSEEMQTTQKVIIVAQEMTEVQERNNKLKLQSTF